MDNELTILRIESLIEQINLIEKDLANCSLEEFGASDLLVRATCFSFTQIGEGINKIHSILKDSYPNIAWNEAIAMRNIVVHDYYHTDYKTIYKTAKQNLPDIKIAFLEMLKELKHIA